MNKCINCNKEIKKQNKFCNSSCAATYNNKKFIKRKKQKKYCINCSAELTKSQKKYCDAKCQQIYRYNNKIIPSIKKGTYSNSITLKKYLFETRGSKCEICNMQNIWNNKPITLQLDHIDGNSDNNNLKNLRLLCPNCHTQTDTFCAKNHNNSKRNTNFRLYYKNRNMV